MTVTLARACSGSDAFLFPSASFGLPPTSSNIPITIGSEQLLVVNGASGNVWGVLRGQNGSGPSAHDVDTEITIGWGGGGGSISATDGTTTMPAVTSLSLPAGTLSDLGGGVAGVGLINSRLSADIAFDTPNLINPSDDGPVLFNVPAGSSFTCRVFPTIAFNQAGYLLVVVGEESGLHTSTVAFVNPASPQGNAWAHTDGYIDLSSQRATVASATTTFQGADDNTATAIGTYVSGLVNLLLNSLQIQQTRAVTVEQDSVVCIAFYPIGADPTAGAATIRLDIATPAS